MNEETFTFENADVFVKNTSQLGGCHYECVVKPHDGTEYRRFELTGFSANWAANYAYRKWNEQRIKQ